jgi:hypothetical protein
MNSNAHFSLPESKSPQTPFVSFCLEAVHCTFSLKHLILSPKKKEGNISKESPNLKKQIRINMNFMGG